MNTYQDKQYQLFEYLEKNFNQGNNIAEVIEPISDFANDDRMCLTAISFIPPIITNKLYNNIINPLKTLDDRQYYYLPESLHLTIQNIRTINKPALFSENDIEKVRLVFQNIIPQYNKINFELKGLFETPSSFSIRGYCDDSLQKLIFDLRKKLVEAGVPDNKKYASNEIFFGNITLCRYTTKPNEKFFEKIKNLKNIEIGALTIEKISLIATNAVAYPNKTKIIGEFSLR